MSYSPCPKASEDCRFYETELGCVQNIHHDYWPKKRYTGDVAKEFRELPQNKGEMCMREHGDLHATERPPARPSREEMIQAIASQIVSQEVA